MAPPPDHLRATIKLLVQPGSVTEMRALGTLQGITSGYFDNLDALLQTAATLDGFAKGVHLMLNPVLPELLARAQNVAVHRLKPTTCDNEIVRRLWLMLDFDPRRPSGISSTNREHDLAITRARECRSFLFSVGWPEPILADSGNGSHLLYRIDLPNDAESTALVKNILSTIGLNFTDSAVEVDQSTFNPARLTKFYGTLARKGSNTPERPHRRSAIIEAPDRVDAVSFELLKVVAGMAPETSSSNIGRTQSGSLNLEKWITDHALPIRSSGPWGNGGQKWVLEQCPWNDEHKDSAAFIVKLPSGAIGAGCLHNGCSGRKWSDLRDKYEPGWRERHGRSDREESPWEPPIPFSIPSLPTFPTTALPMWLRSFVEEEAEATQTPPDLSAMLILSVVAAAIAKKVKVLVRKGWSEPPNLYTVTALPPGNRKSGVFQDVIAPLNEYEQEQIRTAAPRIAEAVSRRKIAEVSLQKAETMAATAKPEDKSRLMVDAARLSHELESAKIPVAPRMIADDTSSERLATMLRDQGGRMAVMSPEGDVFDLMAGRYSASGSGNFGVYLKAHAGDTLRVDRVGRPPEFVQEPALTMGLAVQPDVLRGLTQKPGFRGRGLLGRFLYCIPRSLLGYRAQKPQPLSDEVRAAYHQCLRKLLDSPFGTDQDGNPTAHIVHFSPEADEALCNFEAWIEPQLADGGALGTLTDWAAKLAGAVVRISGILHMADFAEVEGPWQYPIPASTVDRAIQIGKYAVAHAHAAFEEMGADPDIENARRVLDWIQKQAKESLTKRDIFNGTKALFPRVKDLEPALDLLEEHGYLRERSDEGRTGPGRPPSPTYLINPLWLTQNPHKAHNAASSDDSADIADSAASSSTPTTPDTATASSIEPANSTSMDQELPLIAELDLPEGAL